MEAIIDISKWVECVILSDPKTIGYKLNLLRIRADMTVKDVSAILTKKGFRASPETVYAWERGTRNLNADAFLFLCVLYKVNDVLLEFGYKTAESTHVNTNYANLLHKAEQLNSDGCAAASIYIDGLLASNEYRADKPKKRQDLA